MNFKISIIVPVYNTEEFLSNCLNSLIKQTYENLEIIIVDDGSTDNSSIIAKKYVELDNRVKLIVTSNGGVSSARNKGLSLATGDYVMFLDSDDYIALDTIEFCLKYVVKYDADICKFNYKKKFKHLTLRNKSYIQKDRVLVKPFDEITNYIFETDDFCSCCECLIRSNIARSHSFDERISIGEDFLFFVECLCDSKKIYISNKCKYFYVLNESSITSRFNYEKYVSSIDGLVFVTDRIISLLKENLGINQTSKCKLERNLSDYFSLCYQMNGVQGTNELIKRISSEKQLADKLIERNINFKTFGCLNILTRMKLKIKKFIKGII